MIRESEVPASRRSIPFDITGPASPSLSPAATPAPVCAHAPDPAQDPPPLPASEALSAVHVGLYVSALRCILTYVVAPVLGTIGVVLGPLGTVLQVLGAVTSIVGARRLWQLRHPARLPYAGLAALVTVLAAYSLLALVPGAWR